MAGRLAGRQRGRVAGGAHNAKRQGGDDAERRVDGQVVEGLQSVRGGMAMCETGSKREEQALSLRAQGCSHPRLTSSTSFSKFERSPAPVVLTATNAPVASVITGTGGRGGRGKRQRGGKMCAREGGGGDGGLAGRARTNSAAPCLPLHAPKLEVLGLEKNTAAPVPANTNRVMPLQGWWEGGVEHRRRRGGSPPTSPAASASRPQLALTRTLPACSAG